GSMYLGSRQLARREARRVAFMCAIASIETIGLTPDAVGKVDASQTTRSRTSQVWPSGSQADVAGDPPIRAVPMMWNENMVHRPGPKPAASTSRMKLP